MGQNIDLTANGLNSTLDYIPLRMLEIGLCVNSLFSWNQGPYESDLQDCKF